MPEFDESQTLNRREILTRSALGLGSLGLMDVLTADGRLAMADESHAGSTGPLDPKLPHFRPRAKRVIHFFLNGGPSHVDTFDPKPALKKYEGKPLGDTFATERKTGPPFLRHFSSNPMANRELKSARFFPRPQRILMTSP